jgi:hypothetical protein
MRPRSFVIFHVSFQDASQARGIAHDQVIEALSSKGSDEPFGVAVLPRRSRCRQHVGDRHRLGGRTDTCEREVPIVYQVPRRVVSRECFAELLGGPRRGRMGGDRHVHDTATLVRQDDQHEEESICGGGHHEEIGGCDLADMIREKRAPRL